MATKTGVQEWVELERDLRIAPRWNVVLHDDDEHSYEYVIVMLQHLFHMSFEKAFLCAKEVDGTGRVILLTTSKEHAELKQEQVHGFGPDPAIDRCRGAMTCTIEPAP